MDKDKLWHRAEKIGNAELLEFQRYIENKALREDVRKLRAGASLPLTLSSKKVFFEDPAYKNWMGWDDLDNNIKIQKHTAYESVERSRGNASQI